MKKNDILTLEITALTSEGQGVARENGMVVFVPFSAIGDKAEVKILKVTKSVAYGKIERIIEPSADRINSDCNVFGKCGGCTLRHISYEAEALAKETTVRDAFTRIGKLSPEILPIIKNEDIDHYRNKAQFPIGKNADGKAVCGFFAPLSHRIVECSNCKLQPETFAEIVQYILDFVNAKKISVYDEAEHKGVMRHICIRKGYHSGEINVTLVARRKVPEMSALASGIMQKFKAVKGVVLSVNTEKTNVILGDKQLVLAGEAEITDTMCGNAIKISPTSFYQVNTKMAEKLYAVAKEFAEPSGKTVLDLYCGAGTIGLSMAHEAERIIGVEIVPSAIENAKENAAANGFTNTEFICGDAGQATAELLKREIRPDVIVLDPARQGCDKLALDNILKFAPEKIVMISCNPSTAARDCAYLCENGYNAIKVQSVDMFSRTSHVETVVLITRVDK